MNREQILARLAAIAAERASLRDEFRSLSAADEITEDQQVRFEALADGAEVDALDDEEARLEKNLKALERFEAIPDAPEFVPADGARVGAPQHMKRVETAIDFNNERKGSQRLRDAALAILDDAHRTQGAPDAKMAALEHMVRSNSGTLDGDWMARRVAATENPAYRSAFAKYINSPQTPAWSNEEARAVEEYRAASQSLTDVSGGFGVPVVIDPTIIFTTGASDVPILRIARIEQITNNVWKGVTSAPAAWSYDAESATVSNDQLTVAQPVVTTYMARAFIPYTIEISGDYPGFANEMGRALSEGYMQLIASQSMTGSGSAPQGIFTAIDATAAREVVVTTSGSLSAVDVLKAWNALGEQWRSRSSWVSSVSVESKVRVPATDIAGLYTVDLTAAGLGLVNGRPYYTSDYAPAFTGTTGTVNLLVVGDFSNFVVAQRVGMNVEAIPHLFDVTDNRPIGQRGLFAWARHGFDSVNDNAFTLLKNAT